MLLWVAAAPVSAIPPSFTYTIFANDCGTGAPIQAGAAVFAAQHFPAALVVPIAKGLVGWPGPIGLGDFNFVTTVSAPGYRDGHWVFHGSGNLSKTETWTICLHRDRTPAEKLVETTYPITITCTSTGETCDPTFTQTFTTDGVAQLTFTASTSNCSDITAEIGIDGSSFVTDPLAPGDSVFNAWPPLSPGSHQVTIQATGIPGGCNSGDLAGWGGDLLVTTSAPA